MTVRASILVVEDDLISQRVMALALEGMGYKLSFAASGEQALSLFAANRYDLVFMDLGLPNMDGLEATQQMRLQETTSAYHTPIIALTAHSRERVEADCLESGMDAFLSKPIELEILAELLKNWL